MGKGHQVAHCWQRLSKCPGRWGDGTLFLLLGSFNMCLLWEYWKIFSVLKLIFFLLTGRSLHQLLSLLSAERGSQLLPSCRSLGEELHSWWFCTYKTAVLKVRSLTLRPRAGFVHVTDRQLSLPATRCEKPEGPMCDAGQLTLM